MKIRLNSDNIINSLLGNTFYNIAPALYGTAFGSPEKNKYKYKSTTEILIYASKHNMKFEDAYKRLQPLADIYAGNKYAESIQKARILAEKRAKNTGKLTPSQERELFIEEWYKVHYGMTPGEAKERAKRELKAARELEKLIYDIPHSKNMPDLKQITKARTKEIARIRKLKSDRETYNNSYGTNQRFYYDNMRHILARMILSKSLYYCPIDTGKLRDSVRLNIVDVYPGTKKGNILGSIAGYIIRYHKDYATYVHEGVDKHHDFPTQAKFLEDAAMESIAELEAVFDKGWIPTVKIEYDPLTVYIGIEDAPGGILNSSEYVPKNTQDYSSSMINEMMNFTNKGLAVKFEQFEQFLDENGDINMHDADMSFKTDMATSEYFTWLALARYYNKM